MKVLMFGWEFPPHISGGLGTACHGLAKGLIANDIQLTFVVPKAFGDESDDGIKLVSASDVELSGSIRKKIIIRGKKEYRKLNQPVSAYITPEQFEKIYNEGEERTAATLRNIRSGKLKLSGQYGQSLFNEVAWYGEIASQIAALESYDVIHSHDWLTYPAGINAKKISGKPLVVHVHATEFDRCGEIHNKQVFDIEQRGMSVADKVITVSNFTRNIVINKYKIDPLKVVTVYNATDPLKNISFRASKGKIVDDNIVTYLGRITWQKGPEYFIKAAYKVLQKMDNVRFVLAGAGDLLGQMIRFAAKLKIADRLYFTGFLRGDDVNRMFAMSDLYVMPSVSEPFGISPLEAIQNNVPVIISKQSGVSEIITHAIKVDFWDIDAMADAIYSVLNYPAIATHIINNSRREAGKFQWSSVGASLKEIYYQVIHNMAG